ncbi:Type II toxin-antitoxin system RnlB family antitoxin [Vibrio crassostreae]|uniref:type II toxin-antitoxin system RnlB family antitoxin n=1 Tax=Vibrio crassostreae TaxID=246167 RepID=UPI00148C304D|nr:type II toxin-antitoxin system RnlB family antitoxin [Vibrio crassostreae]NOH76076.1 type II toxin-antitoxin system RnlB family antitoxin [Vibrio crassostreae]CAK2474402.1 Type II toxin-antitoxin system RnlB family antitoxin [Vibrio crassostreae]CAK2783097.1 Type II toxin-antitoxin system RnlB family antitoxin [Vibrio crassostreae]CAK3392461.1 Type II toxin-antitoxin system RnlB family antitoxin [Vibrio crassostreae]
MNKYYELIESRDQEYAYMSMSTDFSRPDEYKDCLESELKSLGHHGCVIFDLLLCNGFKKERFYSAYFDGAKIINSTFVRQDNVRPEILKRCADFYQKNYELVVNNQVLTKPQKFILKKGIVKIQAT